MIYLLGLFAWCFLHTYFSSPLKRYGLSIYRYSSQQSIFKNTLIKHAFLQMVIDTFAWFIMASAGLGGFIFLLDGLGSLKNLGGISWGILFAGILAGVVVITPIFLVLALLRYINTRFPEIKENASKLEKILGD